MFSFKLEYNSHDSISIATISAAVLSCKMPSSDNYAHIDFSQDTLTHDQLEYACLIAYASYCIWSISEYLHWDSSPRWFYRPIGQFTGWEKNSSLWHFAQSFKDHPLHVGGSVKNLKVTNTHAVVSVSRVFVEGMIIKAQKQTLQQLGPTPFTILVPLKYLYTRAVTESHLVSQTSAASMPALLIISHHPDLQRMCLMLIMQ